MRDIIRRALALVVLTLMPMPSISAQDYPTRPVRVIVPYPPGGSADTLGRVVGNKLSSAWGQQVIIDNRAGANGMIGTEAAARAEPDGYTVYLGTDGPISVIPNLSKHVPYDWKRDFAPVSMLALLHQVLIVHPSLPARSVQDLIALAKQRPGTINYASIGIGSSPHLAAELFRSLASVDITHVPYRGSAQAITDLLSGEVSMFFVGTSTAAEHIKKGALRALAVTSPNRLDSMPDVPTFAEVGLPGVNVSIWFGIFAPAATPAAVITKLNSDLTRALDDAELQKGLAVRGFDPRSSSSGDFGRMVEKDFVRWRDLIQKIGLKTE